MIFNMVGGGGEKAYYPLILADPGRTAPNVAGVQCDGTRYTGGSYSYYNYQMFAVTDETSSQAWSCTTPNNYTRLWFQLDKPINIDLVYLKCTEKFTTELATGIALSAVDQAGNQSGNEIIYDTSSVTLDEWLAGRYFKPEFKNVYGLWIRPTGSSGSNKRVSLTRCNVFMEMTAKDAGEFYLRYANPVFTLPPKNVIS